MSVTSDKKKFKIVSTLEDDAPFGDINWYTISFLTPQRVNKTKHLDVKGFMVHNGYNTYELADESAKLSKQKNKEHDVYVAGMGKIYAWDDVTRADLVSYDNDKLNELERKRRENIDKVKLMSEQFRNEHKSVYANPSTRRKDEIMKRIQKKLYDKGLITQQEYEMIHDNNKTSKETKEDTEQILITEKEIMECKIDYLNENEPIALKFGCITIYSPKRIGGLPVLCFKIRGLFQTEDKLKERVKELIKLYPNDRIYTFEIGKWCPFSEIDGQDPVMLEKQLNYSMKCYLDNLVHEEEEFNKRKDKMQGMAETEAKMTKAQNKRQKRKEAQRSNQGEQNAQNRKKENVPEPKESVSARKPVPKFDNTPDGKAIEKVFNFLDDPELHDKYPADKSKTERMEIDPNAL